MRLRIAAGNAFLMCMTNVFFATGISFASFATAWHRHYLAALLVGFLASILWRAALTAGFEASRLFSEVDDS